MEADERQSTHWDGCATEGGPRHYECARVRIESLTAELAETAKQRDYLKLWAQVHAQEARCQGSTVNEVHQLCSGFTGEQPGSGAEPVRAVIAQRDAALAELREARAFIDKWHKAARLCSSKCDCRYCEALNLLSKPSVLKGGA